MKNKHILYDESTQQQVFFLQIIELFTTNLQKEIKNSS